jgi:hypothetical protein
MLKPHARLLKPQDDAPESGTDVIEETQTEEVENDENEEEQGQETLSEESELTATIGEPQEEDEDHKAPGWIKELRKENREKAKKLKEYEAELQRLKGGQSAPEPLKKPKIEDFDYDSDAYEQAMDKFYAAKVEQDKAEAARKQAEEEQQKEWQSRQESYKEAKGRFSAEEMEDAEAEVVSVLSPARQAMLLDVADDPATLVLALGKNPEALRKLAAIKSDGQAIKEMVKLEMNIKVAPKGKTPPPPERTISGAGKTPGGSRRTLEQLREEAQSTSNYTKYFAEKLRQKG